MVLNNLLILFFDYFFITLAIAELIPEKNEI